MKTSYWYARCLSDSDCYSIRTRNKVEAKEMIKRWKHKEYGPIVRVKIEGPSLFQIIADIQSEAGNYAEASAHYEATKGSK